MPTESGARRPSRPVPIDPMWRLEPRAGSSRPLVTVLYVAAVVLFFYFQEMGLALRRTEQRAWWAGTGRDVLNLAGVAFLAGALYLAGYPAPAAILVAGNLTLILFGAYVFMATQTRSPRPRTWATAVGLLAALSVLLWPAEVLSAAAALAGLFPGLSDSGNR